MTTIASKRAIIWGFGGLGREIARAVLARQGEPIEIVGIVDTAPSMVGRPAAEFVPGLPPNMIVAAELSGDADLVFHGTESNVAVVERQLKQALAAGYDVITAAEWMFYPWLLNEGVAQSLDAAARAAGRRVMGCGINPGFAFDTLPLLLCRTMAGVRSIEMLRISNVSGSGRGDFKHVGFALPEQEFRDRLANGDVKGHIGFPESIAAIADRIGMKIDRIVESWEPIPAVRVLELPQATIGIGEVVAIRQEATAFFEGVTRMSMVLEMHLDPEGYGRTPREEVVIEAASRTVFTVSPAPRSTAGAAAMMAAAAVDLGPTEPGVVDFLDLPLGGAPRRTARLVAGQRSWSAGSLEVTL